MKRPFLPFLLPALLLLSLPLWGGEREEASDFTLETLSGERLSLSDRLGKEVIYLSFWATWCTPCRLEMGHLERLYRKYRARGFTVIAVNIDDSETVSQVRPFVRQQRFTFPVVLDRDRQVAGRYDPAGVIPYGVLIDR
ncbi:MAG: TlpA family protein disulfide reductase, partial [Deltaproteobacteria bacterium]